MKTALILHAIDERAGSHWQQWLHDELVQRNYKVLMPDLPNTHHPDRNAWFTKVHENLAGVQIQDLILVDHSLGVTTALDYIEQLKGNQVVAGLVSVSGFARDYGSKLNNYFLKKKNIDLNLVKKHIEKPFVIYGNDDPYVPQSELNALARGLGVEPIIIEHGGHLNTNAGYTTFPLLLTLIFSIWD